MPRTTILRGHELINVAGESHHQDALRSIIGTNESEVRVDVTAHLVPEPENEHDAHAVRIEIEGAKVGYLPRELASLYAPALGPIVARGRVPACEAAIVGRGPSTMLGVFLRLPPPDDPLLRDDPSRRF